jgi:hypothetical protein
MGKRKPVVLDTLVAAPVGAGGGLLVNVTGGAGQAVSGIPLLLSSGGGTATTDASGCARWDSASAGTGYGLTASVNGYVQPDGSQNINVSGIAIVAEETAQLNLAYDRGGSVAVKFQQRVAGSSAATDLPSYDLVPSDVSLSNASVTVTKPITSPTGATGTAGLFYPYTSSYGVYADSCTAAKPTGSGLPASALGTPSPVIPAGGTVSTTLELPSLNAKFTNNGTLPTSTNGITVRVKTSCGTIITGRTVRTADGTLTNPGLPFDTNMTVCAVNAANTMRIVKTGQANTTYAAPSSSSPELKLTTTGATCPF